MGNHICTDCLENNHGWCKVRKMNGMKKSGITICEHAKYENEEAKSCVKMIKAIDKDHKARIIFRVEQDNKVTDVSILTSELMNFITSWDSFEKEAIDFDVYENRL